MEQMEQAENGRSLLGRVPKRLWPWLWLGLALLAFTPWIDTTVGQGNVASDLAAIESLVERHTFFINGSTFIDTIDKFRRGDLYFSQKSPIFHLIAGAVYAIPHTLGLSLAHNTGACLRLLTLVMVVLPMGWLLWLIFSHPWVARRSLRLRVALTLAFALGSLMTPFAVTLNHYVLASACLMAAVNALTAAAMGEGRPGDRRLGLTVGFWIAASLACDVPPAFLFGAGLGAVWLWCTPRRLLWLAAGAAPILLLYAVLNLHIVGSPLPPNMHESEMLYYPGSYWSELKARAQAGDPGYYQVSYARRLIHSTVGHKGIYWMMPLMTATTLAGLWLARRHARGWALALAWAAFPPVAVALVMRWAIDLSGGAYLIRHVLATIPPLYCTLAHPALPRPGRAGRWLLGGATAWGLLIAAIGVYAPWSHNTLSAYPPLENLARLSLRHAQSLPTEWIGPLIRATSVTPDVGWLDLGLAQLDGRRLREAEVALQEATRARPDRPLPYYHLGIVQDMRGHPREAIATYQNLLRLDAQNLGGWNNLGIFALKAGLPGLADEAYARSLALAPGNASALWGRLLKEELTGRTDPNSPRLREALAKHPQDPRIVGLARRWGADLPPKK